MFDLNKITYEGEGPIVNEFCLATCTVNGSGTLPRTKFFTAPYFTWAFLPQENIFPSNIKGLPTWFVIRASRKVIPTTIAL